MLATAATTVAATAAATVAAAVTAADHPDTVFDDAVDLHAAANDNDNAGDHANDHADDDDDDKNGSMTAYAASVPEWNSHRPTDNSDEELNVDDDYRLIDKTTSLAQSILQRQTDCISFIDTSSSDLVFPDHLSLFMYQDIDFDFDVATNNTIFDHCALSNFGLHQWMPELSID